MYGIMVLCTVLSLHVSYDAPLSTLADIKNKYNYQTNNGSAPLRDFYSLYHASLKMKKDYLNA